MNNTVYLLGAGVNQAIKDYDGLSPTLINNFFQIALNRTRYIKELYTRRIRNVYDYIEQYWRKDRNALASTSFDLEECFTLLEFQRREAININDKEKFRALNTIRFRLISFVAEVLSDFEMGAHFSDAWQFFGKILYKEKPFILTFNYDCFFEGAIEHASGESQSIRKLYDERAKWEKSNPKILDELLKDLSKEELSKLGEILAQDPFRRTEVSDEELANSEYNWNKPLGYGIKFDYIQLQQPHMNKFDKAERFYSHPKNKLYPWSILKLHGSLNWFRYIDIGQRTAFSGEIQDSLPKDKKEEIILFDGRWWLNDPPSLNDRYIDPVIITPILNKEEYLRDPLYNCVFTPIWKKAREVLANCKRLVVIGYSFPTTDFSTKRLFLEAFSENPLKELIIVNPDTSVVQKVKSLTHFDKPVTVCENLEEFLRLLWLYV